MLKHHLGLEFKYTKKDGGVMSGPKRHSRIRKFVIELSRAIQMEDDGKGEFVICFTDESYIHQNHGPKTSWVNPQKVKGVNRASGKGRRLIILHAITRYGFLSTSDADKAAGEWASRARRLSGCGRPKAG